MPGRTSRELEAPRVTRLLHSKGAASFSLMPDLRKQPACGTLPENTSARAPGTLWPGPSTPYSEAGARSPLDRMLSGPPHLPLNNASSGSIVPPTSSGEAARCCCDGNSPAWRFSLSLKLPPHVEHMAVVQQPVQHRRGDDRVAEQFAPLPQHPIALDRSRAGYQLRTDANARTIRGSTPSSRSPGATTTRRSSRPETPSNPTATTSGTPPTGGRAPCRFYRKGNRNS